MVKDLALHPDQVKPETVLPPRQCWHCGARNSPLADRCILCGSYRPLQAKHVSLTVPASRSQKPGSSNQTRALSPTDNAVRGAQSLRVGCQASCL